MELIERLRQVANGDIRVGPFPAHTLDTAADAADEIERLRKAEKILEYIATYRNGFDGTEAGRLGLVAHNFLTSQ